MTVVLHERKFSTSFCKHDIEIFVLFFIYLYQTLKISQCASTCSVRLLKRHKFYVYFFFLNTALNEHLSLFFLKSAPNEPLSIYFPIQQGIFSLLWNGGCIFQIVHPVNLWVFFPFQWKGNVLYYESLRTCEWLVSGRSVRTCLRRIGPAGVLMT